MEWVPFMLLITLIIVSRVGKKSQNNNQDCSFLDTILYTDFPNSKSYIFQAFQEQVECKKNNNWEPRKTPISRNMLICSILIIIFSFLFIIFSFIFIMFGYELFCVEFFESDSVKYYIESRKNATNQTCPDI